MTVQVADVCAETGFSSQNGDCLDEYTTKEQLSAVHILWANGLNVKDINKEMFPVYADVSVVYSVSQLGREILSSTFESHRRCPTRCGSGCQQSEDFYSAGFDTLVKRWDKRYQCWWRICREICFFQVQYHMFYILHNL
jgi:hypothetical protein